MPELAQALGVLTRALNMENDNNNNGPKPGNPDVRGGITNQPSTPTKSEEQNPRPRKQSLEEIILEILLIAARKASPELEGIVVPHRIAEAENLVARGEAKAIIAKAINYAKGIAADKKFRGHHLLRELGIKLPADNDGGDNPAGKKARRNAPPAQSGKAQPAPGKTGGEKPKPGIAGEGKP